MATVLILSTSIFGQEVFDDGGVVDINRQISAGPFGSAVTIENDTTVNLLSNGEISGGRVGVTVGNPDSSTDRSRLNLFGGTIASQFGGAVGVSASGRSKVKVESGSVSATGGGAVGIELKSGATATISGGTISAMGGASTGILVDGSTALVSGGSIQTNFTSQGDIVALNGALVTIFGLDFDLPYGEVDSEQGSIRGTLRDGSRVDWSFLRSLDSSIVLSTSAVPEPGSSVIVLIFATHLLTRRRRQWRFPHSALSG